MLTKIGPCAKAAARVLAVTGRAQKDAALLAMAEMLRKESHSILKANEKDISQAEEHGVKSVLLDRLLLTKERIEAMAAAVVEVASLPDPIGEMIWETKRPNGLTVGKRRVPMGVVGMIYEGRPNVTADASALCLKSGNACILRGGREALNSNIAIASALRVAVESAGLPVDAVNLLEDTTREGAQAMMRARGIIDVLLPRGGAGLIKTVVENSSVPVIETGIGNCHVYVEKGAEPEMAVNIVFNAKTSRPSVCNAAESLLIDEACAKEILPLVAAKLAAKKVELRGCEKTQEILKEKTLPAQEEDFYAEFLDNILAIKVVSGPDEAIEHINKYGSSHSDAIVTSDYFIAERFLNEVDSAAVFVNASTRFTDGGEFGLGAEIGISTQKLHARGPMGLAALTSEKYIVRGSGQIR